MTTRPLMTRSARLWCLAAWCLAAPLMAAAEDTPAAAPSPKAVEAIRLLASSDPYQRELGFLRLEALREPATVSAIKRYVDNRNLTMRAYSLRALAAIEGTQAVPFLLERLRTDREPVVRRAALLGLEPLAKGNSEALAAFLSALRDHDTQVRMAAVDIVSRIDDPKARAALLERNRREHRRDVRRVLSMAMKRIGQP